MTAGKRPRGRRQDRGSTIGSVSEEDWKMAGTAVPCAAPIRRRLYMSKTTDASSFALLSAEDRHKVLNALGGGASRREVLGMLGALGAAGTFGSSLLGGLGSAFAAETPKKGGRI